MLSESGGYQTRTKFNTLTLAEARKLNRSLSQVRAPIRTASVLSKPRPPPLLVTNLDAFGPADGEALTRANSIRSESLACCTRDRRHSVNYGALSSHLSLLSQPAAQAKQQQQQRAPSSASGSISNLSFKSSSRDTPDCAYAQPPAQWRQLAATQSVHLGSAQCLRPQAEQQLASRSLRLAKSHTIARVLAPPPQTKLSDESFASAKSELHEAAGWPLHSGFGTPRRAASKSASLAKERPAGSCRSSLTASTYKALQAPFTNFRRLFRLSARPTDQEHSDEAPDSAHDATLVNSFDSGRLSQLERSQTPPVCPPPPSELKSMSYMSSRQQLDRCAPDHQLPPPPPPPMLFQAEESDSWQLSSLPVCFERNLATVFEEQAKSGQLDYTSGAPGASYQRSSSHASRQSSGGDPSEQQASAGQQQQILADPPRNFEDFDRQLEPVRYVSSISSALTSCQTHSLAGSCQSLASTTTTDSVLDFRRQQQQPPVTPYRFSFAQPLSPPAPMANPPAQADSKQAPNQLPPRVPFASTNNHDSAYNHVSSSGKRAAIGESQLAKQISDNNSSSGNSSNCSSQQLNVINNCDRLNSLESSERNSSYSDESSTTANINRSGQLLLANNSNGTNCACKSGPNLASLGQDLDATLLSDASTLLGDASGATYYMNKCSELERTVAALKNKLICKEKELTELQLNQLNYDYTIEKLRSQLNKFERENQLLKRRQQIHAN